MYQNIGGFQAPAVPIAVWRAGGYTLGMTRLGILGCGVISDDHAAGYIAAGAQVVAVADLRESARRRLAERFGVPEQYESATALIDHAQVDAVSVALPNHLHAPISIRALDAGMHVLCEKPMALNRHEAAQMVAASRRSGRLLMMGMNQRFIPAVQKAAGLVASGALGDVYHVEAVQRRRYGIPGLGGWFTTRKLAGAGPLFDCGSHAFDRAWYIMGRPQPMTAFGVAHDRFAHPISAYQFPGSMHAGPPVLGGTKDVEDFAVGLVTFANGATLTLEASWAEHSDAAERTTRILGSKAGAVIGRAPGVKLFAITNHRLDDTTIDAPEDDGTGRFRHFVDCIEGRAECLCPGEQGLVVQSVLDALLESSRTGRAVAVESPSVN